MAMFGLKGSRRPQRGNNFFGVLLPKIKWVARLLRRMRPFWGLKKRGKSGRHLFGSPKPHWLSGWPKKKTQTLDLPLKRVQASKTENVIRKDEPVTTGPRRFRPPRGGLHGEARGLVAGQAVQDLRGLPKRRDRPKP